jgi:iron complex outermembrane receptor protein
MNSNQKLSYAIAAILSGSAGGFVHAATAADAEASDSIAEITVTAQRRAENLQNVPISIQALTAETLSQLNVANLDDFVKYLPNVTTANLGPGQGNIYMRGLSVGALATQGEGSVGPWPNVAVYFDEQSSQVPSRNLDIYAVDLERVEVLEGPQGTLFGAGAEAGVVRFITNKPKIDVTEGDFEASYGTTAHGDPNSSANATINLPVIDGKLAVRAVIYTDTRGGYINNLPGVFTRHSTDYGIAADFGGVVPPGSVVANNNNDTGNAINPQTYQGMRVSGLYKVNEDWDVLVQQSYQQMQADGVFYEMPLNADHTAPLPPLSVNLFNPSYDKDKFEDTALTVNGKAGDMKLVYSGSYLSRNMHQQQDYTNYARGLYAAYYQCPGAFSGTVGPCYSPAVVWTETEKNTHQSHELRMSTPDDWRFRGVGGVYWEEQKVFDDTEWEYKTVPDCAAGQALNVPTANCFLPIGPVDPAAGGYNNSSIRNSSTAFFDDFQRTYTQKSAYMSLDFDLLPKVLTITAGTRYYDINNSETGAYSFSFGCYGAGKHATVLPNGACGSADAENFATQPHQIKASGFKSRANLSWHVTGDILAYYTWSQGYRPGGFNRGSACHLPNAGGVDQWCVPYTYQSDSLTNNEIGWKSEWFNHRLEINGAVYREQWNNVQTGIFNPSSGLGNLTVNLNGPNYRVNGVELQLVTRVTDGLTLQGAASWNSGSLVNSPQLLINNPALAGTPGYGGPVTSLPNPYGQVGSSMANSPPLQANLRARYEWNINDYRAFSQFGFVHQAHSYSLAQALNRYDMPGWTTYDASIGVSKGNWRVEAFGQNLTDVNKSLFTSAAQSGNTVGYVTETPMRPRVLGVRFGYKFSDLK